MYRVHGVVHGSGSMFCIRPVKLDTSLWLFENLFASTNYLREIIRTEMLTFQNFYKLTF